MIVVLVVICWIPSSDIVASWCSGAGELEENPKVRSRGIGEGSFLCDSGPFGHYCKGQSSDSWFLLPRPVVSWDGNVYSCEGQMLLLLLGFPLGKNISLIYSIVLPGKAVTCVCMCMCMHTCMYILYVCGNLDKSKP